jgi:hypothetical protein
MGVAPEEAVIQFLKRRYASAIGCGDDRTATRLRVELDRLLNGPAGNAGRPMSRFADECGHNSPELPPAA